jgi:hypothetical protein
MVDVFLKGVDIAKALLTSAKNADAGLAARTADVLNAVQTAIRCLGQEAQALHEQVARIDLQAPDAGKTLGKLSTRVGRYLREDHFAPIVTDAQQQLIVLRSKFADYASATLPSARRDAMDKANAELNVIIDQIDQFIRKFLVLTGRFPAGTGVGATTLATMDQWLAAGKWRSNPSAAQESWQQAAAAFRASPVYREWRDLDDRLGETAQRLVTAFPEARSK